MHEPDKQRRSWRSMRITARFYARYAILWGLSSGVPIIALNLALFLVYRRMWQQLAIGDNTSILVVALAAEAVGLTAGVGFLYMLAMHRISGPYINIINTLERINRGETGVRMHFRKTDHLDDISAGFNAVMDKLEPK